MDLLVLGVHGVFRKRLQMLPAAERAEPTDIRPLVYRKVAAVTFAIDGTLGMRRPKFSAFGDGLAVGTDQPLRDIETATVAFGEPDDGGEPRLAHGFSQP